MDVTRAVGMDVTRAVGICSRTGSAVAVAVDGTALVGRWSLDLTGDRVPAQVWHAAANLSRPEAEALVSRAVEIVAEVATRRLRDLLADVGPVRVVAVVVGDHPVPESLTAVLASHALMHAAEGQLYRDALLDAAAALGLPGVGLPRGPLAHRLAGDLAGTVRALGTVAGPPWRKEHKLAAAAALSAFQAVP
jgi:hypothetical protein